MKAPSAGDACAAGAMDCPGPWLQGWIEFQMDARINEALRHLAEQELAVRSSPGDGRVQQPLRLGADSEAVPQLLRVVDGLAAQVAELRAGTTQVAAHDLRDRMQREVVSLAELQQLQKKVAHHDAVLERLEPSRWQDMEKLEQRFLEWHKEFDALASSSRRADAARQQQELSAVADVQHKVAQLEHELASAAKAWTHHEARFKRLERELATASEQQQRRDSCIDHLAAGLASSSEAWQRQERLERDVSGVKEAQTGQRRELERLDAGVAQLAEGGLRHEARLDRLRAEVSDRLDQAERKVAEALAEHRRDAVGAAEADRALEVESMLASEVQVLRDDHDRQAEALQRHGCELEAVLGKLGHLQGRVSAWERFSDLAGGLAERKPESEACGGEPLREGFTLAAAAAGGARAALCDGAGDRSVSERLGCLEGVVGEVLDRHAKELRALRSQGAQLAQDARDHVGTCAKSVAGECEARWALQELVEIESKARAASTSSLSDAVQRLEAAVAELAAPRGEDPRVACADVVGLEGKLDAMDRIVRESLGKQADRLKTLGAGFLQELRARDEGDAAICERLSHIERLLGPPSSEGRRWHPAGAEPVGGIAAAALAAGGSDTGCVQPWSCGQTLQERLSSLERALARLADERASAQVAADREATQAEGDRNEAMAEVVAHQRRQVEESRELAARLCDVEHRTAELAARAATPRHMGEVDALRAEQSEAMEAMHSALAALRRRLDALEREAGESGRRRSEENLGTRERAEQSDAALAEVRLELRRAMRRESQHVAALDEQLWLTDQRLGQRLDELAQRHDALVGELRHSAGLRLLPGRGADGSADAVPPRQRAMAAETGGESSDGTFGLSAEDCRLRRLAMERGPGRRRADGGSDVPRSPSSASTSWHPCCGRVAAPTGRADVALAPAESAGDVGGEELRRRPATVA